MRQASLLFVGSSQFQFTDFPDQPSLAELSARLLAEMQPLADWQANAVLAYPQPNMLEHVRKAVQTFEPAFVVLFLGSSTFAEHKVQFAISKRSPRLARLVGKVTAKAKKAAGGGSEGSPSLRGLLFRLPSAAGRLVFGAAPRVAPEVALAAVKETIAALQDQLTDNLLVILSSGVPQTNARAEESAKTIRWFNTEVSAYCEGAGVRYLHPIARLEALGLPFGRADGLHADRPTREALAQILADEVVALWAEAARQD